MITRPQRERTRWDWKPLIVIPMMVYINVGLQPSTAITDDTAAPSQEGVGQGEVAVPAPINAAPRQAHDYAGERGKLNLPYLGSFPLQTTGESRQTGYKPVLVAAPVQGVTGDGRAYVLERNPKYPLLRFEMRLAQPNTIVDCRGGI